MDPAHMDPAIVAALAALAEGNGDEWSPQQPQSTRAPIICRRPGEEAAPNIWCGAPVPGLLVSSTSSPLVSRAPLRA